MHRSAKFVSAVILIGLIVGASGCGSDGPAPAATAQALDRTAWLGSPEGWGVLGFPARGGALVYRGAEGLEAPTWAPLELKGVRAARSGDRSVWLAYGSGGLARYDYQTGHLLSFEDVPRGADLALALDAERALLVVDDSTALLTAGGSEEWRYTLPGRLLRLVSASGGRVIALVHAEDGAELLLLEPPQPDPVGRRRVPPVQDVVVTAWGRELYYLPAGEGANRLRGLGLPELEPIAELALSRPGRYVAATPSAHRLYVAAGDTLLVYSRSHDKQIGRVGMPAAVRALRFGLTGGNLIARLQGVSRLAILQVGVDSVLGVIPGDWEGDLPLILPGGRLVVRAEDELVMYTLPGLEQVARIPERTEKHWLPVNWHPPRPRPELTRETPSVDDVAVAQPGAGAEDAAEDATGVGAADASEPAPGFYAVVLAARTRPGIEGLARRLRRVGYPALVDLHTDVTGTRWFRAMVGPYPGRARAEAVSRALGARYGYKPWILSVDGSQQPPGAAADSVSEDESAAAAEPDEGSGSDPDG